jgi:hypothetical protein
MFTSHTVRGMSGNDKIQNGHKPLQWLYVIGKKHGGHQKISLQA